LGKLPDTRVKLFDEAFVIKDQDTGEPIANHAYRIKRADGTFEYGQTDAKGQTHLVSMDQSEKICIEVL
jgi:type VI secretion system secreted protein VgrG